MKDVLEEIVAWKKIEVCNQMDVIPMQQLYKSVEEKMNAGFVSHSMRSSLSSSPYGIIAEFKRRSPSKGWIKEEGSPEIIPASYEAAGASALSILTDEKYFGGSLDFIQTARPLVQSPILRKDFIINEYQLFQARDVMADVVLLIAACLSKDEVKQLTHIAHELKLEVLLEIHGEKELEYCDIDVDLIGVNNRDLGTFHTDVQNSYKIINKLPTDRILVSESGISNPKTVFNLRQAGFRGFLMGEYFMRNENPGESLRKFISEIGDL